MEFTGINTITYDAAAKQTVAHTQSPIVNQSKKSIEVPADDISNNEKTNVGARSEHVESEYSEQNKTSKGKVFDKDDPRNKLDDLSDQAIQKAIEKANKQLSGAGRELDVSVHEKTKRIMVKIIDSETDKVIREVPPEKSLDFIANVLELTGILVDEKR